GSDGGALLGTGDGGDVALVSLETVSRLSVGLFSSVVEHAPSSSGTVTTTNVRADFEPNRPRLRRPMLRPVISRCARSSCVIDTGCVRMGCSITRRRH